MEYKDYYKTLGVKRDSTSDEIRQAYRKLARKYHPDVNPNNKEAEERFKEINEAHEVLTDPEKRRKYDQLGANWQQFQQTGGDPNAFDWSQWATGGGPGGGRQRVYTEYVDFDDLFGGGGGGFSDFFQTIFGGGGPGAQTRRPTGMAMKGRDFEQPVQITLEEAYHGTTRILQIGDRRLEIKIPAGVHTGSRVRVPGEGEPSPAGGQPGDLYLVVEVMEHPVYKREGNNLRIRQNVNLYTMVLGGDTTVQTLKGRVSLRIPPETKAGQVFRLRGQGMLSLRNPSELGDLYVEVIPELPEKLNSQEKELFRQLAEIRD